MTGETSLPCPCCGNAVDRAARRCGRCGAHVELAPDGARFLWVGQRCVRCGNDNESGLAFCGYCGERLNVQCRRCGASNLALRDHCAVCGAPLIGMDEVAWRGSWQDHTVLVSPANVPDMVSVQARYGWELEATTTPIRTGREAAGEEGGIILHFRRRAVAAPKGEPPQDYVREQMAEEAALQMHLRRARLWGRVIVIIGIALGTLLAYWLFSDVSRRLLFLPRF